MLQVKRRYRNLIQQVWSVILPLNTTTVALPLFYVGSIRERERDRQTETERDMERPRETGRDRERPRERETGTETETYRNRQRQTESCVSCHSVC